MTGSDRGAKALAEREAAYWGWAPEFIDEETMDEMRAILGSTGLFIPDVLKLREYLRSNLVRRR
jgi:hypothetical protein